MLKNFELNKKDDYSNPDTDLKDDESDFQGISKALELMLKSKNLNEKLNKLKTVNITKINTFALAYTVPEIKSKYALAANILYLIQVHFNIIQNKQNLVNNDEIEYKHLLEAINHGFNTHYRMDIEDV